MSGPPAGGDAVQVRPFTADDVGLAIRLTTPEGWAFDAEDFHRLLRVGGGYVAEAREGAVGVLTTALHGDVAWIGNVAVDPDHRGRGVGEALVRGALRGLTGRGATRVGLYSVPRAVTLYQRLGFEATGEVVSRQGAAAPRGPAPGLAPMARADLDDVAALDERLFGAPRRRLLEALLDDFPRTSLVLRDGGGALRGYAFAKPAKASSEVGPVGARPGDAHAQRVLLDGALSALDGRASEATTPAGNRAAAEHLEKRGLREAFRATTMWRGQPPRAEPAGVAAVAGLEKG